MKDRPITDLKVGDLVRIDPEGVAKVTAIEPAPHAKSLKVHWRIVKAPRQDLDVGTEGQALIPLDAQFSPEETDK